MAIKNILVAYDGSPVSEKSLQAALQMQAKYDAHLTGILIHMGQRDHFSEDYWMPDNVRSVLSEGIHASESEVEGRFRSMAESQVPHNKLHWYAMSGDPDTTLAKYSVMYDLTVIGQHTAGTGAATELHPERIALKSGRPVLVIPETYDPDTINRRAVLAFDGRMASTRALHDAMQVLETKSGVDVVSIGDVAYKPENSIGVVDLLARHGVAANRIRLPQKKARRIGQQILAYCAEVNAGMLVMGAYEHGLIREELFGGATKYVAEHANIPVMVTH